MRASGAGVLRLEEVQRPRGRSVSLCVMDQQTASRGGQWVRG